MELMKNKSKHSNSDGEKNIPQKEISKRKESIKTNKIVMIMNIQKKKGYNSWNTCGTLWGPWRWVPSHGSSSFIKISLNAPMTLIDSWWCLRHDIHYIGTHASTPLGVDMSP